MPYNGKYIPDRDDFYKLSRSKVDFFLNCSRCFYMDRRLGIAQPPGFLFNLNSVVDNLLKYEICKYVIKHKGKYLDYGFMVKNLSLPPAPNQIQRQYFRKRFSLFKERYGI
jgi:hypothetical protein